MLPLVGWFIYSLIHSFVYSFILELVSVHTISGAFDIDPLPKDAIRVLLQRIGVEDMKIRDCRMYGTIQPKKNIYEIAFSGE